MVTLARGSAVSRKSATAATSPALGDADADPADLTDAERAANGNGDAPLGASALAGGAALTTGAALALGAATAAGIAAVASPRLDGTSVGAEMAGLPREPTQP